MKIKKRKAIVDRAHALPVIRQCQFAQVSRSSIYYQPTLVSDDDQVLMRLIDEIHLKRPFPGSRRIQDELIDPGHQREAEESTAFDAAYGDQGALSQPSTSRRSKTVGGKKSIKSTPIS